jgi:hypothetical protein
MGKVYDGIDGRLRTFIESQPVFFVATAPGGSDGHINVSPKGLTGTFVILDGDRVAYLDYYGSGAETIAHLRDNGRIVLMFCAFTGPPSIVRLHGRGEAVLAADDRFDQLWARFPAGIERHGVRSVIVVDVDRVSDSCGFSVPLMDYTGDRYLLQRSHSRRSDADFAAYAESKNARSIDGLPALQTPAAVVSTSG